MSIIKNKNFVYLKGPKGDKGDKGDPGSGVANGTGRIIYNSLTKTISFNEEGLATTNFVTASINNLINGAPLVLDTLNEIAAAIDNNPNFVTDITADIDSKLSKSGGTLTGALILNADPVASLQAATKQYVDNATSNLFSGSYTDLTNKPTLFDGIYSSLTGKPTLFSGSYTDLTSKPNLFSGAYADLTGKPTLFDGAYSSLTGKPTLSTVATSGSYADLTNKPTLFDGTYSSLTGKPTLFDGAYSSLTDKPTIPASINDLTDVDTTTAPSVGDALIWNGTNWVPGASASSVVGDATLDGGSF